MRSTQVLPRPIWFDYMILSNLQRFVYIKNELKNISQEEVPHDDEAITTCGNQLLAVWRECYTSDAV